MDKTECDQEKPEENFDPRNNVGTYMIRIDELKDEIERLRAELEAERAKYTACPNCHAMYESQKPGCGYCEAERVQGTVLALRHKIDAAYYQLSKLKYAVAAAPVEDRIRDVLQLLGV